MAFKKFIESEDCLLFLQIVAGRSGCHKSIMSSFQLQLALFFLLGFARIEESSNKRSFKSYFALTHHCFGDIEARPLLEENSGQFFHGFDGKSDIDHSVHKNPRKVISFQALRLTIFLFALYNLGAKGIGLVEERVL